ncbi:helix-hairpin-helix domain-containing protein [Tamlana fucoidanivorans]|uniref:Helix-hairpin-helix domain-containing protein n=1 Tax=Allotamlana fucoidanivorans TaxID=2583814 RepID=A0A5C4SIJ7_9FLAO|nr:helix-hairpin-helix domain-containing protein [Tamlana fucoidanivorans]TNJ43563.1 helix-hairpin-helix domain-containing protein [Tamlana fucoidanivorans]
MKSHFQFSKKQRHGIFLLLILIVLFQCLYFFISAPLEPLVVNEEALLLFEKEVDSLRQLEIKEKSTEITPFNPNFITDYKGYVLGMSNVEIDRLLQFRKDNKWINSSKQFQEVTQVSDSLLEVLSPYFKFPEWINNSSIKKASAKNTSRITYQKKDLNQATAGELQVVNGVGEVLSNRIIKFRNRFKGGFADEVELYEVYDLSPEVIQSILKVFELKTPRSIKTFNINTITVNQLVTIPYIDYELAHQIIEQRQLKEGYNSIDELQKVKGFPVNKIDIIKLYLHLEKETR